MNSTLGKVHFWLTFLAFNGVFFPMHILGVAGHMRRIANPLQYEFLQDLQPINVFITICAFILGTTQIILLVNVFWSIFKGKVAEQNPWHANTLEWQAPTPVPHGNFDQIPHVYHGPYEYPNVVGQSGTASPESVLVTSPPMQIRIKVITAVNTAIR